MQADTQVVLEQMNVWCQCMHGVGGAVAGSVLILLHAAPCVACVCVCTLYAVVGSMQTCTWRYQRARLDQTVLLAVRANPCGGSIRHCVSLRSKS